MLLKQNLICLNCVLQLFLLFSLDHICNCRGADNLALLDGTLRTFQQAACDGEVLDLQCPLGTAVNIQIAHYGRASSEVEICNHHMALVAPSIPKETPVCNLTTSMQHALLHMVVDTCSKKRSCKIPTAAESLSKSVIDPCSTLPKFVEIAYKCRPNEFRSKIACEGENLLLKCKTGERIAIFSVSYGRPHEEKYQCPQTNGLPEEICQSSLSTETAMKLCQGKITCNLEANNAVFGNASCSTKTRKYLRVIFTCVSRKILKDQYTSDDGDEDSSLDELMGHEFDRLPIGPIDHGLVVQRPNRVTTEASRRVDKSEVKGLTERQQGYSLEMEPSASSPYEPGEQGDFDQTNEDLNVIDGDSEDFDETKGIVEIISEWIGHYSKENNEKLVLYLTLGIAAFIVAVLGILVARLWYRRRKAKTISSAQSKNDTMSTNVSLPGFNDEVEDVDNEIDLTLVPPQEFYTGDSEISGTMRRDPRRESSFQCPGYSSFSKSFDSGPANGTIRRDQVTLPRSMTYNSTSLYYD